MYILQRAGLQVYVVEFPGGKDPDEMLQSEGGDELFSKALKDARPLVLHHISLYLSAAEKGGQVKAAEDLLSSLAQLPAVELAPYMQEIAHALGLPDYQLAAELHRLQRGRAPAAKAENRSDDAPLPVTDSPDAGRPVEPAEAALVSLLWNSAGLRASSPQAETVKLLTDERLQTIAAALLTGVSPDELERRWLEIGDRFPLSALARGEAYCDTFSGTDSERWNALCAVLTRRRLQSRYDALKKRMYRGEATPEELTEYARLSVRLKNY
jgi:DNA primase